MKIIAYSYTDPLLESSPDQADWGWEVDRVYEDLGKQKSSLRSQLQQLFTDCQTEPADYLLIRRLEELGDTVEEISDRLNELEVMGIAVIATEQPYTSENYPLGADLLNLLNAIQRQQRSRRIRQGHARNRLDVAPPPGKVPYGYRRGKGKYTIDRSTSPVVKDFFEHFLLYGSLRGSVRYLANLLYGSLRGSVRYLAKKYGKKISVTTGRRWLTNPVYRGNTAYQNGEIISNTHIPIISKEEAAQVDRLLRRNSRLPSRTALTDFYAVTAVYHPELLVRPVL